MAAGAHCLRLVRNAVSSSRTFVHADSVVVVPIQLTLWKITHVWSLTAFPSIFCLCMNHISVCVYSVPSLLYVFCGCGGLASKTYGWQWLIRWTWISVFFRKYSHFFLFLNSYWYFNHIDFNIFCMLLEIWGEELKFQV